MKKKFRGEHSSNTSSILRTIASTTPSIAIGQAVVSDGYHVVLANSTNLATVLAHVGITTSAGSAGSEISIIQNGLLDPNIFNLGDGYACTVGCNSSGILVRVTDVTCASGLNYVGHCDGYGTITVAPRRADHFNALDFGARGDGITDDTGAIMTMIRAAKTFSPINSEFTGIKLYFPHGIYLCSQQINFDANADDITHDWPNVTLQGEASAITSNSNFGSSTLLYTGTGSSSFISALSSSNFCLRDLSIVYNNNGFTGALVDFGVSTGLGSEASYSRIESCIIGCYNSFYQTASEAVRLDSSISSLIRDSYIGGANYGINIGSGSGTSVITTIRDCQFQQCFTSGIANPGFNTTIMGCVFEDINRAVYCDGYTLESSTLLGFVFANNWVGDNENDGYAFIDFNQALVEGGAIYGNTFGKNNCIRLGAAMNGLAIYGNTIGTIDFSLVEGGSYPSGVVVFGNTLQGTNEDPWPHFKNLNNNCRGCITFGNAISLNSSDTLSLTGHIVTTPIYTAAPMLNAVTNITPTLEGDGFQGSNDTCGRITLVVTGGGTSSGTQCTLTFAKGFDTIYGHNPHVFLTPESGDTVAIMPNIYTSVSGTAFSINSISGITPGTYVWSYFVIQ